MKAGLGKLLDAKAGFEIFQHGCTVNYRSENMKDANANRKGAIERCRYEKEPQCRN